MRTRLLTLLVAGVAACGGSSATAPTPATPAPAAAAASPAPTARPRRFDYPPSARGDVVDDYHGTKVPDPYRWLEDPDSPATRAWIDAQNKLTFRYLESLPARARFKQRLEQLWSYERFGIPEKGGKRYIFDRNSGLQNQDVLHVANGLEAESIVLIDPNTLSSDGTVALQSESLTEDGKSLAYALSAAGSDWIEWRVRDVGSGADHPDHLQWSKFSGAAWTKDGKGFFYGAYDPPAAGTEGTAANYYQKLYFHRLGTPQAKDQLVYERKDQKEWGFGPQVTDDGRYLVIRVWKGSNNQNQLFVKDLTRKNAPVVEVVRGFDNEVAFAGNIGTRFFFRTDKDAPRGRVVAIDLADRRYAMKELVPEDRSTLEGTSFVGDTLIAQYLEDAHARVTLFSPTGAKLRDVALPGLGTVAGFAGRRDDKETFYSYESFTVPKTIYRLDLTSYESKIFKQPKLSFDPEAFETQQVFYESKDGTKVPMFIVAKKGLQKNGQNPTFLYGYGGFNISMTPKFSETQLAWVEAGGVFAQACLRGGGEYGRAWHEAGIKEKKQNVFDDFIAAAEYLIRDKVTSTPKLGIGGGSNGGLLVGAVLNQRPELFGAAIPQVGVMDMLRYHKFTIGWAWVGNYGSSDDPDELKTLLAYSPLHTIKAGASYPPVLVTTADHDDRVVPAHSFKYTAALQAAQGGPAPVLIRIETRAGHGAGKPTSKKIEEAADRLAFLAAALGM